MNLLYGILLLLQVVNTPPSGSVLDFFLPLLNNAPAFAILLYFSYRSLKNQDKQYDFLKNQLEIEKNEKIKKESEIKELNDYIRTSEKENLELLSELNSVIDNLMNNVRLNNDKILLDLESKVQSLKSHIDAKIAFLSEEIKQKKSLDS